MKKNTIRYKLFLNSLLIIALALIMIFISYDEFNKSSKFSEQILPLAVQMTELVNFKGHFETFEEHLEEYLAIGTKIHMDYVNDVLGSLFNSIQNLMQHNYYSKPALIIESNCIYLKELFDQLLSENYIGLTIIEKNDLVEDIFFTIKNINILHDTMSKENLDQIQYIETNQQESIYSAIFKLSLIGCIIIAIYIVIGLILSKNISGPILKLKKATAEISNGNYNIKADIKNSDEIGELASHFNSMAFRLKMIIEDLTESEEKYRTLFENANDAIVIQDENFIFSECNNKALEIFKTTKERLIGKSLFDISPEKQQHDINSKKRSIELFKLAFNSNPQFFEWEIIAEDNTKIFTEISLTKIESANKKYLQAIIRDISERKKRELQIRQLSSDLLKAQERERQKISKILHDSVMQTLTASKLYFDIYKMKPVKQSKHLDLGVKYLGKASDEIKEIYTNLYPEILTDFGIKKTIEWHLKNYIEVRKIKTDFRYNVFKNLEHDFEVNLYRIFQDIFSNIIEHSRVKYIRIIIEQSGNNELIIETSDDGTGFSKQKLNEYKNGFRIKNISQRVFDFNGSIEIKSEINKGTTYNLKFRI